MRQTKLPLGLDRGYGTPVNSHEVTISPIAALGGQAPLAINVSPKSEAAMGTVIGIVVVLILLLPVLAPGWFSHTRDYDPVVKKQRAQPQRYRPTDDCSSMSLSIGNMRPH
ncbi:hypothetical protein [Nitrospirillum sp. BR 11828]|uniref:hypothetical protein n=1 Tax=Nitrospirillum sp. BR 11828 TaxID=3104325 RepID=UPI002ACAC87D|nr:hypothetical protein [Nitrospirillum sp. BR 11828]MDZ5646978.1 hypothetical protein [Nitrospirillum sp. BR 11828]